MCEVLNRTASPVIRKILQQVYKISKLFIFSISKKKHFRIMSDVYEPPERVQRESHCRGMQKYNEMYNESIDDPKKFWRKICQQFYWKSPIPEGKIQIN